MEDFNIILDSTYPLRVKFRELCPGTDKHSVSLSQLTEAVSHVLRLDVDLMRTAALYHDIGKMNYPSYFSENQPANLNLHDSLEPWLSYRIITRHVDDGVNILINDKNFPRKVIEIISQHHGDTLVQYFYNKAIEKDSTVLEKEFRYKCTKPQTLEAAVLMICDSVEATSKSKLQSGNFNPVEVVNVTLDRLFEDKQLDDVTTKMSNLRIIREILVKELEGSYQKRVDYDEVKKKTKKEEENVNK